MNLGAAPGWRGVHRPYNVLIWGESAQKVQARMGMTLWASGVQFFRVACIVRAAMLDAVTSGKRPEVDEVTEDPPPRILSQWLRQCGRLPTGIWFP